MTTRREGIARQSRRRAPTPPHTVREVRGAKPLKTATAPTHDTHHTVRRCSTSLLASPSRCRLCLPPPDE